MSHAELAVQKERRINGSHVNYYLVVLEDGTVAEVEDIIEFFDMNFALGTTFKSLIRMCKLRHDLGKPGSTTLYESQKVIYYLDRLKAIIGKQVDALPKYSTDCCDDFMPWSIDCFDKKVSINVPKRLSPYSFSLESFIQALEATVVEAKLLRCVFGIAYLRKADVSGSVRLQEEAILQQEIIINKALIYRDDIKVIDDK